MSIENNIRLQLELPPTDDGTPLSRQQLKDLRRMHWDWINTANALEKKPASPQRDQGLMRCEEALTIILAMLDSQPSVH